MFCGIRIGRHRRAHKSSKAADEKATMSTSTDSQPEASSSLPIHAADTSQLESPISLPIRSFVDAPPPEALEKSAPTDADRKEDVPKIESPNNTLIRKLLRSTLHPLTKHDGNHVDGKMLKEFGITCTEMDFTDGRAGSLKSYIHPYPLHKMKEALNVTRPLAEYGKDALCFYKEKNGEEISSNQRCVAVSNFQFLVECATGDSVGRTGGLIESLTNWVEVDLPNTHHLTCYYPHVMDWRLHANFRPCLDSQNGTRDPEKPHITGLVCDAAAHRDDALLRSELVSALYLAFDTAADKIYAAHRFIPVTILSGSGRKMRVVQCVFDTHNGDIDIRKSPIIDFKHGILADKHETQFHTLLGWILSEPVGKTRGNSTFKV